ncbi:MAG: cation:proton antiporter [Pseudomonadota bacterium]
MEIVAFVLVALCLMLGAIAFAVPVATRLRLPLPVVVATGGILLGTANVLFSPYAVEVTGAGLLPLDAYDQWLLSTLALGPDTILIVFLPPLLFEMALAVNVRRMLEDWATVLILAVLAVAAATAAVGLAVFATAGALEGAQLGIIACLLLGAAVATTDPAAVITTFRGIGAPRRLIAVLEGESLLNDAAAIAIFTTLLAAAAGESALEAGAVGTAFLHAFLVGAATGFVGALLAARLYPVLGGSALAETSATVMLAYGTYLAAEQGFGASGVVAVVFAGLTTGTVGFVRMGPANWAGVRQVWAQIGFWANNLVLLLVAVIAPPILFELTPAEFALLLVVYLAALLARALILFGVMPVIEGLGPGGAIEARQKLLLLWGGVRGAVTLLLALSLHDAGALGEEARLVAALAAAYALSTLIVNASTLAPVTRALGLHQLSDADLAIRERIIAGSIERVRQVVKDLARRREFEPEALAAVEKALRAERREAVAPHMDARVPFGDRLRLGLDIAAAQEARLVRRGFEEGAIDPAVMLRLRLIADRLADGARIAGRAGYEAEAKRAFEPSYLFRLAIRLHRWFGLERPLAARIETRHTALLEMDRVLRELEIFCRETLAPMIGADAAENIAELMHARLERADAEIEATERQYPIYCAALEQVLLARAAIRRERQQFDRLSADGIIGPELHGNLVRGLDRRGRAIARPPRLDLTLTASALLDRVSFFSSLDGPRRRKLARRLRVRLLVPGSTIIAAGERPTAAVFVASGALAEAVDADQVPRLWATGDALALDAIGPRPLRREQAIRALTFSKVLTLSRRDWRRFFATDPVFAAYAAPAKRKG